MNQLPFFQVENRTEAVRQLRSEAGISHAQHKETLAKVRED